jgi:antitoxin FitA
MTGSVPIARPDVHRIRAGRRRRLLPRCRVVAEVRRCARAACSGDCRGWITVTGSGDGPAVSCRRIEDQRLWRQNGAMPSVQIKDVPEQTHAVLRRRAAAAHQSLQEYLRARLVEEASHPTVDEVLARAGGRAGGSASFAETAAAVRDDRARG